MKKLKAIQGLHIEIESRPLVFKKPAKTSRDILKEKPSFFIRATDSEGRTALSECSIIPSLNPESTEEASELLRTIADSGTLDLDAVPMEFPSVRFAVESVLMQLHGVNLHSEFSRGNDKLEINGLVWIADAGSMLEQVVGLKERGFKTIKLKIGALDFEEELKILRKIRSLCPHPEYTLRLDANGAWGEEALEKIKVLEEYNIHSIEQPVAKGNLHLMSKVCAYSPIPISLDEELINVFEEDEMSHILDVAKPEYIILKPSLIGGLAMAEKWVRLAEERNIGWWSTSALESNVGLEVIADWTAWMMDNSELCQGVSGLGTGSLFTNNTETNLTIENGHISHKLSATLEVEDRDWTLDQAGIEAFSKDADRPKWTDELADFLKVWANSNEDLECQTSGSTGAPKTISHSREAVCNSAIQTLEYFNLKPGDSSILALPLKFIAGKLMVIRALVGKLHLIAVNPNLQNSTLPQADFIALTPHQATRVVDQLPAIHSILLGGSPIPDSLSSTLASLNVYEGFGMTETITHIALRHINDPSFTPLPGVTITRTDSGNLTIDAPLRHVHSLVTDDLVELHSDSTFSWLGRASDTINSGGLKFEPEILESKIAGLIPHEFAIYGVDHPEFGTSIELRIDTQPHSPSQLESLKVSLATTLNPVEMPRSFRFGPILRNENGKILRKQMKLPVIVFATGNSGKAREVAQLLDGIYTVKSLPDIGCHEDIPETADTLEGNAELKARYVKENYGYDCFADDTGLEVSALNGAPGVFTARYGGPEKNAEKNMEHLLSELESADSQDRSAQFRTAIHVITGETHKKIEGICSGAIATERSGTEGFGYDPVFIPKGENRTFSEMSSEEKNKISHRGLAIREMLKYLSSLR